jgi:hypothetical protein
MTTTPRTLVVILVVITALAGGLWLWRSNQAAVEPGAIDLIDRFPEAEKRTTMSSLQDAYSIQTVTINGDRKRAIFAHPFSRIIWTLEVPEGAVLRAAAALRPDSWNNPGDGAIFRIGVSDGPVYTGLYRQVIRPQDEPGDRRWFPVEVDLSAYAGKQVKIIFNTEPGEYGNAVSDACVWGDPRIVPAVAASE